MDPALGKGFASIEGDELIGRVFIHEGDDSEFKAKRIKKRYSRMPRKVWAYDPHSGGKIIPDTIKPRICQRILTHAQKCYVGKYNRIEVRFSGKFCYIDAYTEPFVSADHDPELFEGKLREERIAQLRDIPTHLCRLRFFGDENKWSMAFYTYSQMKYEPSFFNNGTWHGTPEEAFDTSAVFLTD